MSNGSEESIEECPLCETVRNKIKVYICLLLEFVATHIARKIMLVRPNVYL